MIDDISVKVTLREMVVILRSRLDRFKESTLGLHQETQKEALKPLEEQLQKINELFDTIKRHTHPR